MSNIKIIANELELDFVKETLSIKKENTALSRNFKISHSSVPFLIIENANTKKAIGNREMTSVRKKKVVPVVVFDAGQKFQGELQIISNITGFRKCNLKYASELLAIMDKKISDFMPIMSVIPGETSPVPFIEESNTVIPGYQEWAAYGKNFIDKGFPDVKWNFPTMRWQNKFGIDLAVDDEWALYENEVNTFNDDASLFNVNDYTEDAFEILLVTNINVVMPQVYLLSPLLYALESIGFKPEGSFYESSFIKRLLFLSFKNNLTKVLLTKLSNAVTLPTVSTNYSYFFYETKEFTAPVTLPSKGNYIVTYSFTFNGPVSSTLFSRYALMFRINSNKTRNEIFNIKEITESTFTISGSYELYVSGPVELKLIYQSTLGNLPVNYSLSVTRGTEKYFHEMHPTIELGRYLPDWTFATYLNALQNLFNVEIVPDDLRKKLALNLYDDKIKSGENVKLSKSFAIDNFEEPAYNAFLLKYENDEDYSLWITSDGVDKYTNQESDYLETLNTKFKYIPTTYTANLSEDLNSKSGIGLIIYNQEAAPFTSSEFSGQSLEIEGSKGIYEFFWKNTLKFRLHGSVVEIAGYLTQSEINNIARLNRVYVDNQEYIVIFMDQKETQKGNFIITLNLQTLTF
jgi:hypothetical protein